MLVAMQPSPRGATWARLDPTWWPHTLNRPADSAKDEQFFFFFNFFVFYLLQKDSGVSESRYITPSSLADDEVEDSAGRRRRRTW